MKINFTKMSDVELNELIVDVKREQENREKAKRSNLINTFEKAWKNLEAHNIYIRYNDTWSDNTFILDFENTEFD